jgi:hypothetical protein
MNVLHLFKFFAAREVFIAVVEGASNPATPAFLSALRAAHPFWLRLRRFVGQPILAAAAFQAAPAAWRAGKPISQPEQPAPSANRDWSLTHHADHRNNHRDL